MVITFRAQLSECVIYFRQLRSVDIRENVNDLTVVFQYAQFMIAASDCERLSPHG